MAYDPFFGGGNGTNQILPKRPSKQPQGPGPLRVPDVQMGQPQVAPYAAPYAQPGSSPIQYPAPQTYNRPLTITAAMMQQSPWTQGSRQPFPAPNAPNRLGRLGQTRAATGSDCAFDPFGPGCPPIACSTDAECGAEAQCAGGACEPLPVFAAEKYASSPRICTFNEDCYSYEKCDGRTCVYDPAYGKGSAASAPSERRRRVPTDYRKKPAEPPSAAAPTTGPFAPAAPVSSGEAAVNPATGMTEAEMEDATQRMEDKLICRILTARKTKSGLDGQSREYIEVIAPYADRVARKREICDYAPKVADVIQLPTSAGRAKEAPRGAAPSETVTQGAERPQSVAPPMQPAPAQPAPQDYAAEAAAKEAAAKEAALLEEAIKRVNEMDTKLICKVLQAAAAFQGLDGMSETFVKMLAPYADAVAQSRGICGYKRDEPAPAPEAAKPEPTPVEPGDTLPPVTNGGTPSKPPTQPYTPPPDLMPTPTQRNGGGGGGGYVGPGTYDYGGGGGGGGGGAGGGGGGGGAPPDVRTSRQLVVKQGIPWWVWVLLVGGVSTLAYYAQKKKAGLAGNDEDGKPLMIELENPEEV